MKKLLPLAVVIAAFAVACGGDSDTTPTATDVFGGQTAPPTQAVDTTATASPTTASGGMTATPTGPAEAMPTSTANPGGSAVPGMPSFDDAADMNTVNDFISHFEVLEYEWSAEGTATATYRMEHIGSETVGGVETDRLKTTANDGTVETVFEAWIGPQGNVKKLVMDGQEIPAEQLGAFAPLATTVFFAPLAAVPDLTGFNESYQSPGGIYTVRNSVSGTKTFGDATAETWTMEVSMRGQGDVTWEISDFGDVSLFTSMRFGEPGQAGGFVFEVTEVALR